MLVMRNGALAGVEVSSISFDRRGHLRPGLLADLYGSKILRRKGVVAEGVSQGDGLQQWVP